MATRPETDRQMLAGTLIDPSFPGLKIAASFKPDNN
jgi:hypothetical protein